MGKKSKKGGGYERNMCKLLSVWFSSSILNERREDIFWRTAGSGARATVRKKIGLDTANACGDVGALHEAGSKFIDICNIELKRGYKEISVLNIIDSVERKNAAPPIILKWFNKTIEEAINHGRKHPILIFRRDRKVSCIVLLQVTLNLLVENQKKPFTNDHLYLNMHGVNLVIIRLLDFLKWCDPKAFFKKVIKRRGGKKDTFVINKKWV